MKVIYVIVLMLILSFPVYANVAINISSINDNSQFMLVDYNGKRTGYDSASKQLISESGLSFMMYYVWDPYNPEMPNTNQGTLKYMLQGIFPVTMKPFNMQLVITGMKLTDKVWSGMTIDEIDSGVGYPKSSKLAKIEAILDVNQVAKYDINYVPLQSIVIIKIAAPNDLITDITTAGKLNLIGDQLYINELINKVNEIEKRRNQILPVGTDDEHDEDKNLTPSQKAKKSYQELLQEITDKYNRPETNEFVKQRAYNVLKDDLDYIIGHIQ